MGAGTLHETFLICAVGTILVIRFQLWATNYPQLGGGKLHIAHMLYGGIMMVVAIGLLVSFTGRRARWPAAVIGGIGFGFFIDEVGKFVTSDNDYFFKPSAAIMYLTLVLLYFGGRLLRARRHLASGEYVANALDLLSQVAVSDLHASEREEVMSLLSHAEGHPLAPGLLALIQDAAVAPAPVPGRIGRVVIRVRRGFADVSVKTWFRPLVVCVFSAGVVVILVPLLLVPVIGLADALGADGTIVLKFTVAQFGEEVAHVVAAVLVLAGLRHLMRGRRDSAYRLLERALLVELFVGQPFAFVDRSFYAVWGFFVCLALLGCVRLMRHQDGAIGAPSPIIPRSDLPRRLPPRRRDRSCDPR